MSKETIEHQNTGRNSGRRFLSFLAWLFIIIAFSMLASAGAWFYLERYQPLELKLAQIEQAQQASSLSISNLDLTKIDSYLSTSASNLMAKKEAEVDTTINKLNDEVDFIKNNKLHLQEENYRFWLEYALTYWQASLNPTHTSLLLSIVRAKYEKLNIEKYKNLLASIDKDLEKLKDFPTAMSINSTFDQLFLAITQNSTPKSMNELAETSTNDASIKEWKFWQYYLQEFWHWIKSGFKVNEDMSTQNFDEFKLELKIYITQIKLSLTNQDLASAQELYSQLRNKVLKKYPQIDTNIFVPTSKILDSFKDTTLITKGI